jgi:spore coat polysaccharide biosynthesis protein SpsF
MRIGAIILCRYNSSRLPGKILKPINGKSILENIIIRLRSINLLDEIVVATSDLDSDVPIVQSCQSLHIACFTGSLDNVANRFLSAAQTYDLDYAIRVNGDNIFIDSSLLVDMVEAALTNKYNFISNVPGRTFPYGMSIEIVKTNYYKELYNKFIDQEHFEHVTKYLYDNEAKIDSKKYFRNKHYPELKHTQLAIDTPDDYENTQSISSQLSNFPESYELSDISNAINLLNLNLKK